jgi:hypothetical protein
MSYLQKDLNCLTAKSFATERRPPQFFDLCFSFAEPQIVLASFIQRFDIHHEEFSQCMEFLIPLKQPGLADVPSLFALKSRFRC